MPNPVYQLRNVGQHYQKRLVLAVEELTIAPAEVLAIVGPSGSGKSTLLRLLNFLEWPSQGQLWFNGQQAGPALPLAVRCQVGMVFQQPHLLNRSVLANLAYPLQLRGHRVDPAGLHIWLEKLGLAHLAHQSALKLSAGEAQRVALSRALIARPQVLLLDEPTANLDPYNVSLIEEIVGRENSEQGTTIIIVTHNLFQARRLAGRIALLLNGQLVEVSQTATFFDRPQNPKTAAFVGGEMVW